MAIPLPTLALGLNTDGPGRQGEWNIRDYACGIEFRYKSIAAGAGLSMKCIGVVGNHPMPHSPVT